MVNKAKLLTSKEFRKKYHEGHRNFPIWQASASSKKVYISNADAEFLNEVIFYFQDCTEDTEAYSDINQWLDEKFIPKLNSRLERMKRNVERARIKAERDE